MHSVCGCGSTRIKCSYFCKQTDKNYIFLYAKLRAVLPRYECEAWEELTQVNALEVSRHVLTWKPCKHTLTHTLRVEYTPKTAKETKQNTHRVVMYSKELSTLSDVIFLSVSIFVLCLYSPTLTFLSLELAVQLRIQYTINVQCHMKTHSHLQYSIRQYCCRRRCCYCLRHHHHRSQVCISFWPLNYTLHGNRYAICTCERMQFIIIIIFYFLWNWFLLLYAFILIIAIIIAAVVELLIFKCLLKHFSLAWRVFSGNISIAGANSIFVLFPFFHFWFLNLWHFSPMFYAFCEKWCSSHTVNMIYCFIRWNRKKKKRNEMKRAKSLLSSS